MPYDTFSTSIPPVDAELVDKIVSKLKSQGIFDQFRKDCLADVDTKPAYQNLQQRVNGTVATFLATQQWQPDLNKTQLRESLRRHVQQGFLEVGVDRIVDQVVNPKIVPMFMPKVQDVVCDCLGIEKPKLPLSTAFSTQFLTSFPPPLPRLNTSPKNSASDLLPKDLDPVSPESDNMCLNGGETPVKDEKNNNEASPKYEEQDSHLSGISDLSSHMGDSSFRENPADSNTVKSISSPKATPGELQFDNFTNLTEKIKQAEMTHGQVSGVHNDKIGDDVSVSEELSQFSPKEIKEETMNEEIKYESVSNNSLSTFEDSKTFVTNKFNKEDTCSQTFSEDSMSISSNVINKEKVDSFSNKPLQDSESSNMVIDMNDNSLPKESVNENSVIDGIIEPKEDSQNEKLSLKLEDEQEKKGEDKSREKKSRDSSVSSKHSRSSDRYRQNDYKSHSSSEKKDEKPRDRLSEKDRSLKKEDKEKYRKDEKYRSSNHKHEKEHKNEKDNLIEKENKEKSKKEEKEKANSKDKVKSLTKDSSHRSSIRDDRDKYRDEKYVSSRDKNREKSNDKNKVSDPAARKENKSDSKDLSEKDKKIEKDGTNKAKETSSRTKSEHREKEHSMKIKNDSDKDTREKEKTDRETKTSDKYEKESNRHKDKYRQNKDTVEKEREGKSDKFKYEKDKERGGKSDKEKNDNRDERSKEIKKKESRSIDKSSNSSSSSKKTEHKSYDQDKKVKNEESHRKINGDKNKTEEEKKDRKRKGERCIDEIKPKNARRSSDRDSSGSKGGGNNNRSNSENRSSSSQSAKQSSSEKKSKGSSSNGNSSQDQGNKPSDQVDGSSNQTNSGPSEVELILSRLNSSIEEIENAGNRACSEDIPVKKPKIAKNFSEIRKVMLARKNIDRKFKSELKGQKDLIDTHINKNEQSESCNEINSGIPEENKENITTRFEQTLASKTVHNKTKAFSGFSHNEIQMAINNLITFECSVPYKRMIDSNDSIIKLYNQLKRENNEELLDNNLNKLKPIMTFAEIKEKDNKLFENTISGNNRCYGVLQQDCSEISRNLQSVTQIASSPPHRKIGGDKNSLLSSENTERVEAVRAHDELWAGGSGVPAKDEPSEAGPINQAVTPDEIQVRRRSVVDLNKQQELKKELSPPESPAPEVFASPDSPDSTPDENNALSMSLTEDMLDNLMKESMAMEIDRFGNPEDSDSEEETETKEIVFNNTNNYVENHMRNNDYEPKNDSENVDMNIPNNYNHVEEPTVIDMKVQKMESAIISKAKERACEEKGLPDIKNSPNKRLSRSSQRYSSSELYKPPPVLPQNSKRFTTSKSASSGEVDLRPKRGRSDPAGRKKVR